MQSWVYELLYALSVPNYRRLTSVRGNVVGARVCCHCLPATATATAGPFYTAQSCFVDVERDLVLCVEVRP